MKDLEQAVSELTAVLEIPLIVDADTGAMVTCRKSGAQSSGWLQ